MSEHCQPEQRARVRRARRDLLALQQVEAVSMLTPRQDPQNSWTLDIVVWRDDGLVGSEVASILADHGLAHRAAPQGATVQILAVA
jgi:hypothetical protein